MKAYCMPRLGWLWTDGAVISRLNADYRDVNLINIQVIIVKVMTGKQKTGIYSMVNV